MFDADMLNLAVESYQRLFPGTKGKIKKDLLTSDPAIRELDLPSLHELIESLQPLSPKTCVVGICDDQIPFLLDLSQVETGALLITGDPSSGKTEHLRTIVESAITLNSPHEIQIAVLTNYPEEWDDLVEIPGYDSYFAGVFPWYENEASGLIGQLVDLAEDRASGRHPGATVLLVADNLQDAFVTDFETQNGLHWLMENGPFYNIRPVASMNAGLCPSNDFWTETFRTFLVGKISTDYHTDALALSGLESTRDLIKGRQFRAFTRNSWTKYCLPRRDRYSSLFQQPA